MILNPHGIFSRKFLIAVNYLNQKSVFIQNKINKLVQIG